MLDLSVVKNSKPLSKRVLPSFEEIYALSPNHLTILMEGVPEVYISVPKKKEDKRSLRRDQCKSRGSPFLILNYGMRYTAVVSA